jgi:hypothetical protein
MTKCEGSSRDFGPYVEYWKVLEAKFDKPLLTTTSRLFKGFRPFYNWRGVQTNTLMQVTNVEAPDNALEDEEL